MRFASSRSSAGWHSSIACFVAGVLELSCGPTSDYATRQSPESTKSRVSKPAAVGGKVSGSEMNAQRAAVSGAASQASEPWLGDVPARAASSGNTPCGSSEFSVGPCAGRPASAPMQTDADNADAGSDAMDAMTPVAPMTSLASLSSERCDVIPLPDSVRTSYQLDPFYKKYAAAGGIPIVASDKPAERTLHLACLLVNEMLSQRFDVREALIEHKVTFAIVAESEKTTDIPEYRDLPDYYNQRARGLGGHTGLCAEENILCDRRDDPWRGESICVHEYSHTIAIYGLFTVDPTFEDRLADAYNNAKNKGLWRDTFAAQDAQEYWAEGVQDWYNTNLEADPPDGVHNSVNTQSELEHYDPTLYKLIHELLPTETHWPNCYRD